MFSYICGMPRFLKWLIFTVLCGAYLWLVFFLPQQTTLAAEQPEPKDATEVEIPEAPDMPEQSNESWETEVDSLSTEEEYSDEEMEAEPEPEQTEDPTSFAFYIVSGSYLKDGPAYKAAGDYQNSGIDAEVVFINPYYKVIVGKSQNMNEAKEQLAQLSAQGISAFIQRN